VVLPNAVFLVWLWHFFALDDSSTLGKVNSFRIKQPDDAHQYHSLIKVIAISFPMVLPSDICVAVAPDGAAGDTIAYIDGDYQRWLCLAFANWWRKGI
jgi:hypothetical protein